MFWYEKLSLLWTQTMTWNFPTKSWLPTYNMGWHHTYNLSLGSFIVLKVICTFFFAIFVDVKCTSEENITVPPPLCHFLTSHTDCAHIFVNVDVTWKCWRYSVSLTHSLTHRVWWDPLYLASRVVYYQHSFYKHNLSYQIYFLFCLLAF